MSLAYKLAYRIGFTPWERAGEAGQQQLAALLDREEEGRQAPYGKALDLGCGRGLHSLALARRGWDVTGIDVVPQAVEAAQKGAESEDVDVNFVCADVTAMSPADVGKDFEFLLDIGCFHGLRDEQRMAMAASVDAAAADEATLLLLAFQPGRRGPLPRGASEADIASAFSGWSLVDEIAAETSGMPGPLKKAAPRFCRLRRG